MPGPMSGCRIRARRRHDVNPARGRPTRRVRAAGSRQTGTAVIPRKKGPATSGAQPKTPDSRRRARGSGADYPTLPHIPSNTSVSERATPLRTSQAMIAMFASTLHQNANWNDALTVLRSEEHTHELQSLMRISYAVYGLKKKTNK